MAYAYPGEGALDYFPCRYGRSKLLFRGPHREPAGRYCAMLGGTETYGKFVAEPWPALVEAQTGVMSVNLGCVNAGPDAFLNEPAVAEIAAGAVLTVLQVPGAQNLSNSHYAVHPRRNDRFLRASPLLQALFAEVDFTEFHFTRHMLQSLHAVSPLRFAVVTEALQRAWVARMTELLGRLAGPVLLLWLADRPPPPPGGMQGGLRDPVFVDADMLAAVRGRAAGYVEVVTTAAARAAGVAGMAFGPLDRPAAEGVPGPAVHRQVAAALAPHVLAMP